MTSLRTDIDLGIGPDAAWDALRDFGAVHQRVAAGFVTATRLDGDDRIVTFVNGARARERLVSADDEQRRLVYAVVDSRLGLTHHQASVEVLPAVDGAAGARLVWISDVLPDALGPTVAAMMAAGATAIAYSGLWQTASTLWPSGSRTKAP